MGDFSNYKLILFYFIVTRFFFGKNKVMAHALGKSEETEHRKNLHKISELLVGQCGLLFTNKEKEEVYE